MNLVFAIAIILIVGSHVGLLANQTSQASKRVSKAPPEAQQVLASFYIKQLNEYQEKKISKTQVKSPVPGYEVQGECQGKKILLAPIMRVEITEEALKKDPMLSNHVISHVGSAGGQVAVLLWDPVKNKAKKVFHEAVIDIFESEQTDRTKCPNIGVYLHGTYFHRPGNQYGYSFLEYREGKYQIAKESDGKAVEISDGQE